MGQRRLFAFFAGSVWGTGSVVRNRTFIVRGFSNATANVLFAQLGSRATELHASAGGDTVCLIEQEQQAVKPAVDSIFRGCLPVFLSNRTMNPFRTCWTTRSLLCFWPEDELFRLEPSLLSFSLAQKQRMQANFGWRAGRLYVRYPNPATKGDGYRNFGSQDPADVGPLEWL